MNKLFFLVILFTSCTTEEGKIIKRQHAIDRETTAMTIEFARKHSDNGKPKFETKDIEESFDFTYKLGMLKKEKDSLQKVLDRLRSKKDNN